MYLFTVPVPSRLLLPAVAMAALAAAVTGVLATEPPETPLASECPAGEVMHQMTGVCVPAPPSDVVAITTPGYGGQPEIDGVPCTGANTYECIALAEESQAAGPTPSPHATKTSSP
jgi:hypothetical protein